MSPLIKRPNRDVPSENHSIWKQRISCLTDRVGHDELLGVGTRAIRSPLGSMPYGCVVKLVKHDDTGWVIDAVTEAAHLQHVGPGRM